MNREMDRQILCFLNDLCHPDKYGWAVTAEIRSRARELATSVEQQFDCSGSMPPISRPLAGDIEAAMAEGARIHEELYGKRQRTPGFAGDPG